MIAFHKLDYDIQNPMRLKTRVSQGNVVEKNVSVSYMKLVGITMTLSIHVSISLIIHFFISLLSMSYL